MTISLFLTNANAQAVSGDQLEIGPTGSNQVQDSPLARGAAIGEGNSVSATGLAIGYLNDLWSNASLVVGQSNYLWLSHSSAVFGYQNSSSDAEYVFISGSHNYGGWSPETGGANRMTIFGQYNFVDSTTWVSFVTGMNNVVGGQDGGQAQATATLGYGLFNKWSHSTAVGRFNDSSPAYNSGLLFAVGNGADSNNRSNAFEVYASGKILMPRQGDILMGQFGN